MMQVKVTPKERAYELRERFSRIMSPDDRALAKTMALECLDEIRNAHYDFMQYGLTAEQARYYDDVKSELKKL